MADIMSPEVSIITVGMNHLPLLKEFLNSLYVDACPKVSFELIYVDNCSSDGSVSFIRENYPQVRIIQNEQPQGFAFNNNLGYKISAGKFVAIINPDIILLRNSIDRLYTYLKERSNIGILVPKLLNTDGSVQASVRKFITFKIFLNRVLHGGEDEVDSRVVNDYLMTDFDDEQIQSIDWALGAAMFFTRDWYEFLGGFDEGYFLYVEDVDICLRSWKNEKPVVYYPESVMIHAHQRSSSKGWNRKKKLHLNSMIRYFVKHNILFNPNISVQVRRERPVRESLKK